MTDQSEHILKVDRLSVHLPTPKGIIRAVDDVSFTLEKGKTLAVVGESACGKSMLCRAIMGLTPPSAFNGENSHIVFNGKNLVGLSEKELNRIRGRQISMIFQNPMSSLNPVLTIGRQLMETLRHHLKLSQKKARKKAIELLSSVGISDPVLRLKQYPHQLSGGMRQRTAIAVALSCRPRVLIADEPTTALDVTVQMEILDLLRRIQKDSGPAIILVTHDLGVAASFAHDVAVMYAGRIVEKAGVMNLFHQTRTPYTKMLINAVPRLTNPVHTRLPAVSGRPPNLIDPPTGCRFAPRCPMANRICREEQPKLQKETHSHHFFACFYPESQRENRTLPIEAV